METEADGEDCGGPEPAKNSHPLLQPETEDQTGDSSELEADDSADWKETREHQSALNSLKNTEVPVSRTTDTAGEKLLGGSECWKGLGCKTLKYRTVIKKILFSCSVCDQSFTWYKQLRNHQCLGRQSQTEENREAAEDTEAEADGEDCGGPEPARNSHPHPLLQPETEDQTGDSSGFKTKGGDDDQTDPSDPHSTLKSNRVPVSDERRTGEKTFSCSVCEKCFKYRSFFVKHMRTHMRETTSSVSDAHSEVRLKPDTGDSSEINSDVSDHRTDPSEPQSTLKCNRVPVSGKRRKTGNWKQFSCSECGKRFSKKTNLKVHMIIHSTDKPFSCTVCGKRYSQKGNLVRHMPHHTGEEKYSCMVCERRFKFKRDVGRHMTIHTKETLKSLNQEQPDPLLQPEDKTGDSSELEREVSDGSKESREWQFGLMSQGNIKVPAEKAHSCSFCGKTFARKFCLKVHIRLHTGERPFSCSVCSKSFVQRYHYLEHTRLHTGEDTFDCSVCGKKFGHKFRLRNHMGTHTGEKPFSCSVCGKGFRFSGELKQHASVHSGEKPFSCSVCLRAFRLKVMLKNHMKIHSGEFPFSCLVCGKRFRQKGNLKKHATKHETEKSPAAE
ncbi:gastrula zinc finger protein XlCGF57.1-like [Perca fluviatilis]|uniref:gastrula zinc finger protein XlCGF57.1-like n=1 Tax=Perca fluviatilis TaxID=8168 RepID=UPI0019661B94|nr:gastrula zinc finger protein XlCGF57.1-like [Perca fluviatilis]